MFGKFSNLLMYIFTSFYAIKFAKKYKLTLAVFCLFPTSIFLASSYSYDPTSIGFLMLGTVILVNEWMTPSKQVKLISLIAMYILFFIGSYHKAIYFPFLVMMYFIPKQKFKSKRIFILSIIITSVLIGVLISTYILPTLLNPGSVVGDLRGGDVDVAGQIKFIFTNPLQYSQILIQNITSTGFYNFFQYPFSNLAYLGSIHSTFQWVLTLVFIWVLLTDHKKDYSCETDVKPFQKVVLILVHIATVVLIWTSMFVAFNPVASTFIGGVQARYFFPLIPLLLFSLKPFVRNFSANTRYVDLGFATFIVIDFVMFMALYNMLVSRFWL